LSHNEDAKLEIEEVLQALTIADEHPTLADLAVLTQTDEQQLTSLIQRCAPILHLGDSGEHQGKVICTNPEFGKRLSVVAHGHSDTSTTQKRRYHGLMALRCFKHIKTSLKPARGRLAKVASMLLPSSRKKPFE
jgi:hypothetical protein